MRRGNLYMSLVNSKWHVPFIARDIIDVNEMHCETWFVYILYVSVLLHAFFRFFIYITSTVTLPSGKEKIAYGRFLAAKFDECRQHLTFYVWDGSAGCMGDQDQTKPNQLFAGHAIAMQKSHWVKEVLQGKDV